MNDKKSSTQNTRKYNYMNREDTFGRNMLMVGISREATFCPAITS